MGRGVVGEKGGEGGGGRGGLVVWRNFEENFGLWEDIKA